MDYIDVYWKRLNRYGLNYQERVQNQREHEFEQYLLKATELMEFDYEDEKEPGVLETYKQDETKTMMYLLTRVGVKLPGGKILYYKEIPYMIYYLEETAARGYNRYVLLKMTHTIQWKDREDIQRSILAYMYGQEDNMLKDELRSRSRMDVLYTENLKMSFFITPVNEYINKDDYFVISNGNMKESFVVTGYDRLSTKGVEYVTADPVYLHDETESPIKTKYDSNDDFFWLNGGDVN